MKISEKWKSFLALLILFLGAAVLEAGDLKITSQRIVAGKSLMSLPTDAGALLFFDLTNAGGRDRYVTVSIRTEKSVKNDRVFRKEFFAPANSVQRCIFPFQLDSVRSCSISAEGVTIDDPEVRVFPAGGNERYYLTVTDQVRRHDGPSVNSFIHLRDFSGKGRVDRISGKDLSFTAHPLEIFRAILIYKTDFSRWHAASFEAVREYVKNGGTLCFGTPGDAYSALQTPLADLVPVSFSSTDFRKTDNSAALVRLDKNPGITLFYLPGGPAAGAKKMQSPGFMEMKAGKGIVRASLFDIWQFADPMSLNGYGRELSAFLDGAQIPARPIVFTDVTVEHRTPVYFGFPEGKRAFAVLIVLIAGIVAISLCESILRLIFKGKIKRWHGYLAVFCWIALICLLGSFKGGLLFEGFPLPEIPGLELLTGEIEL